MSDGCKQCKIQQMINKFVTEDDVRYQQAKLAVVFEKYQDLFELLTAALQLQIPALITVLSAVLCLLVLFIIMPNNLFFYIFVALDFQLCMSFIYNKMIKPLVQKLYKKFDNQQEQVQCMQKQISKFIVLFCKQAEAKNQVLQLGLLFTLTMFSYSWSLKVICIIITILLFICILVKALMSNKQIKDKVNESVNASVNFIENKAKEGKQKIQNIVIKATTKKQDNDEDNHDNDEKKDEDEKPQVLDTPQEEKQEEN